MPENLTNSLVGVATMTSAVVLGLLTLKYNDRAIFTERRENIYNASGLPLFGIMFEQIAKKERFLDFFIEKMNEADSMTMYVVELLYAFQVSSYILYSLLLLSL